MSDRSNAPVNAQSAASEKRRIAIVGAGIGGLAAALRLAARGAEVDVFERAAAPGGKMRALPSLAGPVEAGPTVLTMRDVFVDLFAAAGERLDDHVRLHPEEMLARHWWPDGSTLDLFTSRDRNRAAIRAFANRAEADRFERFCDRACALYEAFERPMMRSPRPDFLGAARAAMRGGSSVLRALAPWASLRALLKEELTDPRLRQLVGRYATYVGGSPDRSPAVLALIWEAERRGVWRIEGGYSALAAAIEALARARGARFHYGADVAEITLEEGRAVGLRLAGGDHVPADAVLFNGDPAALQNGMLGQGARRAVRRSGTEPRALSACVWSFAARPDGAPLAYHNVFFGSDPQREFDPIAAGRPPEDPTLYICAQDRGESAPPPVGLERFEIIMNAPALAVGAPKEGMREREQCRELTLQTLARLGLRFTPEPTTDAASLTTPTAFARLFPGSRGSLYGMSPHGMTASFRRPTARTRIAGLYLAGGGAHPGPGAPMAAISGRHAAEAIANDRISRSPRHRTATLGGISMAYRRTAPERSR